MAHILKFKKQAISSLFRHNNRTTGENVVHSNETIDSTRTMQNYFLKKGSAKSLDKRLDEVFHLGSATPTPTGQPTGIRILYLLS